jgi:hypothetical protein
VCARILADYVAPPKPDRLSSAEAVAHALRLVGNDVPTPRGPQTITFDPTRASPDLLRSDPIREPSGPVPGLNVARRPKAHEPPPPTRYERAQALAVDATRDDRRFVLAGVGGALVLAVVIGILVFRTAGVQFPNPFNDDDETRVLPISSVHDFDPEGDGSENPGDVGLAIDGDSTTGWQTSTYYNQPTLGGLKDGVGLVLDLQRNRSVAQVRITLAGAPTAIEILGAGTSSSPPEDLAGLTKVGERARATESATIELTGARPTRYLVVWLTSLPEIADTRYRAEIREVVVRGSA